MLIEKQVELAVQGDKAALNEVLRSVQQYIYNISIRFLWHPQEAEDATQEILIKICTHLSQFDRTSKFTTWVYRITVNYLLNVKRSRVELMNMDFTTFAADLKVNYDPAGYDAPDSHLLEQEVKIGCTSAMLLCLNRHLRIIYILGDIFQMKSNIAAEIMETSPELFRKQLQKSRKLIRDFMKGNCGVADAKNACRCNNMIPCALKRGTVSKDKLLFVDKNQTAVYVHEIEQLHDIAELYRQHPTYEASHRIVDEIMMMIKSNRLQILTN
jgi:RNA polymerase sigma factor (sigma-70 family)